jgi:NTE family protein
VALVLGAGGLAGAAFHRGTLEALREVTGWDARGAPLVVGTSAGALVAAELRAGHLDGREPARRSEPLPPRPGLDPFAVLRLTAPWLTVPMIWTAGPPRLGLLAGWLPRGTVSGEPVAARVRALDASPEPQGAEPKGTEPRRTWPELPTWICATRLWDGARVVFGRDDVDVDLPTAVQASTAIPGYVTPVRVGRHDHIDGGTQTPSNADLVAGLGFDLAVVVSPMTGVAAAVDRTPWPDSRRWHAYQLRREVSVVRARGTAVLTIQPTVEDLATMGRDLMDPAVVDRVAEATATTVRRHLEALADDQRLQVLRHAAR